MLPQPVVADSGSARVAADRGSVSVVVDSRPVATDSDSGDWLRPAERKEARLRPPMKVAEGSGWRRVARDLDWANRQSPAARKEVVPAQSMQRVVDSHSAAAMDSGSAQ